MKIKDLIAKLQELDQELLVVVDGYEGGVTEQITIRKVKIDLNVNQEWYYGEHEESQNGKVAAILLGRN